MHIEQVRIGPARLAGELQLPDEATGLVVFAHGSGSSRLSPRNALVAEALRHRRLGTLLFDLLDEDEAAQRENVFDIALLTQRLLGAMDWCAARPDLARLPLALFGASTGAAAALAAAARRPLLVHAVVSRGGRPDLAATDLAHVCAPTLLVVGEADAEVLALNRDALKWLRCEKRLQVVAGATHLFEEPGALGQVAELAGDWIAAHVAHGAGHAAAAGPIDAESCGR